MRKMTALLLASTLALGVGAANAADSTAAQAQNGTGNGNGMGMMHHQNQMMQKKGARHDGGMLAGIQLTPEQRQQIRDIRLQFRSAHPMHHNVDHFKQLHQLVASDKFDEAAARAQIEANNKTRNDAALARMKMENQIYNLLTPEQKTQVNQNFEKRVQLMLDRQGKMNQSQQ
ncbi:ATP-independent periplasmic protein-refolding chaperone [Edwardsiella ictaluri]|uniref:Spy/CpxP family protein refolding chaperone n=2 Tax=Edwardsiella ictaluri TaxID=67780 RepID=A0ABY8GFQ8_EDWIC|nr:Spy/CpxP family protein refolding chaperone [Edwardsiella ictaluri]ARD38359.1 ATP-independent periplasmic protein-refolding chaperone [Edwardsiella ictaluri]AVZ83903.1 ATP-independent periplasmic protein-refolding chaperone [Edwardsiella ictaluri]EKS7763560.1 Spy/CpxP family protein refolding chaperone [Edwardsiella ictaluri]EKS7769538.1 Spy/CpxP family protein refolding chaperone [Edwardsiella ictaluri]EKS7773157.1 Spy/CpxP family protein refolding chaperone [Edwardsiella ictaluri]